MFLLCAHHDGSDSFHLEQLSIQASHMPMNLAHHLETL